ncbi:hypothetical protein QFC19_004587, partial [Naganishia cerealis]
MEESRSIDADTMADERTDDTGCCAAKVVDRKGKEDDADPSENDVTNAGFEVTADAEPSVMDGETETSFTDGETEETSGSSVVVDPGTYTEETKGKEDDVGDVSTSEDDVTDAGFGSDKVVDGNIVTDEASAEVAADPESEVVDCETEETGRSDDAETVV